jgi:hypothetical protein
MAEPLESRILFDSVVAAVATPPVDPSSQVVMAADSPAGITTSSSTVATTIYSKASLSNIAGNNPAQTPLQNYVLNAGDINAAFNLVNPFRMSAQVFGDGNGGLYQSSNGVVLYNNTAPTGTDSVVKFQLSFLSASNAVSGDAYAMLRMRTDQITGYMVGYKNDPNYPTQFMIVKVVNNAYTVLSAKTATFAAGTTLSLWAAVQGTSIELFQDFGDGLGPQLILSVSDSTLTGTEPNGGYDGLGFYYGSTPTTGFHITGPWQCDNIFVDQQSANGFNPNLPMDSTRSDLLFGPRNFSQELQATPTGTPTLYTPGVDGLITGSQLNPVNYSDETISPGKFTGGVTLGPANGDGAGLTTDSLWEPLDGKWNWSAFTYSFWAKSNGQSWAAYSAQANPIMIFIGDSDSNVTLQLLTNRFELRYFNNLADPTYYQGRQFTFTTGAIASAFAANAWVNFTVTKTSTGVVGLAINGIPVMWDATNTHAPMAAGRWTDWPATLASGSEGLEDGIMLGAPAYGFTQPTGLTFSDDFALPYAVVMGQPLPAMGPAQIAINTAGPAIATVNENLRGAVKEPWDASTPSHIQPAMTGGIIRLALNLSDIDAGAPSLTRTALGLSPGSTVYYDFRSLYNSLDRLAATGATAQLNLIGNNALTGGVRGPWTNSTNPPAATALAGWGPNDYSLPTDLNLNAIMVADVVLAARAYCLAKGYAISSAISLDNEPDGFFKGTQAQWMAWYVARSAKLESLGIPGLQVGPEFSSVAQHWQWVNDPVNGLFAYCRANGGYVDFVSVHPYSGQINEITESAKVVSDAITSSGFGHAVQLWLGESGWDSYWNYGSGHYPLSTASDYDQNAFFGAWLASEMMFCQSMGNVYPNVTGVEARMLSFSAYNSNSSDYYYRSDGLYDAGTGHLGIGANIYQMWSMLPSNVIWSSNMEIAPGVRGIASRDAQGHTWLMLAYNAYGADRAPLRQLQFNLQGSTPNSIVSQWIVGWDGSVYRSDYFDGGSAHENLESGSGLAVSGSGVLNVTLNAQEVMLLELTNIPTATNITSGPANQTVVAGAAAMFAASAAGFPAPTVQWQVSTDGGATFAAIPGATAAAYSFASTAAQNDYEYEAVFTNSISTATTAPATLNVQTAPTVTLSPLPQTVTSGTAITFTAAASANPLPAIQWQFSTDGGVTFADIVGATSTTLSFSALPGQDGTQCRALFVNAVGAVATAPASLTVYYAPVVTAGPVNTSVAIGSAASFSASAVSDPVATIQWQRSGDGGATWANVPGATSTSYLTPPTALADGASAFRAVFTNPAGQATTATVTLSVTVPTPVVNAVASTAGPVGGGTTITLSGSGFTYATTVTFGSVAATSFIVNSDTGITAVAPPEPAGTVDITVAGPAGRSAIFAADQYTYVAPPAIIAQPVSQIITAGSSATFAASASGGFGGLTVQWQMSTDGGLTFTSVASLAAINSTTQYTTPTNALSSSGWLYRAIFTNLGGSTTTAAAMLMVMPARPAISAVTRSAGPTYGGTVVLITGSNLAGATAVQFGNVPAKSFAVTSGSSITAVAPAQAAGVVDVTVISTGGTSLASPADQYSYIAAPTIAAAPSGQTVAVGNPATFTAAANSAGALTIQWQQSTDGGMTFTNLSGATALSYSTPAAAGSDNGTEFRAVFTNAGGVAITAPATLVVLASTPVVNSVAPGVGPTLGSAAVLITGSNFTGAIAVNFGALPAASFTINSDTSIAAIAPAEGAGTVDVTVTASGGSSAITAADQYTFVSPVTVTSVVINGNSLGLAGIQRSMVDSIVYTFSEAVNLAATGADLNPAFTIAVHTGEQGNAPTLTWTAINPDASGASMQWVVTFSGASVVGNSIANGVYDITLNASAVTSEAHPTATIAPRPADTFYRLFGDWNGDQVVNATDNLHFKNAITIYNPIFDYNNDSVVNATDNLQFKKSLTFVFNTGFTPTI